MPRVTYSEAQIDEARAAVYRLGSARAAERELGIHHKTLIRWTRAPGHAERYHTLRTRLRAEVEERLIDDFTTTVAQSVHATNDALDATTEALAQRNSKDAKAYSDAAKNAALVAGIAVDKSRLMQDKPTSIHAHDGRDTDDILRSLNTLIPGLVIDGTAHEIPNDVTASASDSAVKRVELTAGER